MLGGVAALLRWKARRKKEGKSCEKPNIVLSSAYQVVWEKFAQLWGVEMREVPLSLECPSLDPKKAVAMCDENTICVVPIAGVTWTGLNATPATKLLLWMHCIWHIFTIFGSVFHFFAVYFSLSSYN